MKFLNKITFVVIIVSIANIAFAQQTDWTKWRGPAGNGSSPETKWNPNTLSADNISWKTNVGMGHSAVVVKGDKLYTMGNYMLADSSYKDVVVCLNTETAKELWKHEYACAEYQDPGPFSSPLIDDGYLYTLSREGHLFCLDAENGNVVWMQNLIEKGLTKKEAEFENQYASSPMIYKNLLILNQNHHGIAFNKKNGALVWNSEISKNGLSTPVFFELDKKTYMAIQTGNGTMAVNPENGAVLWKLECNSIADPMIDKNTILVPYYKSFQQFKMQTSEATLIWENSEPKSSFQSFVKNGDYIFGFGQRYFQCISLEDGSVKWKQKMDGGSLIIANEVLIIIDQSGKMILAEASAEGYKELSSFQAIINPPKVGHKEGYRRESACWTNPVLSHGKVYLRNTYGDLVCVNVGS